MLDRYVGEDSLAVFNCGLLSSFSFAIHEYHHGVVFVTDGSDESDRLINFIPHLHRDYGEHLPMGWIDSRSHPQTASDLGSLVASERFPVTIIMAWIIPPIAEAHVHGAPALHVLLEMLAGVLLVGTGSIDW